MSVGSCADAFGARNINAHPRQKSNLFILAYIKKPIEKSIGWLKGM